MYVINMFGGLHSLLS